ncbi:class I SAM-dependent methyltransferase [Alterileibacterium massiliense]|uniref:class I SAM-dependent methyltransferase n=1 Tax=Alterileibacterium massiliense TaxID=1870997 RepID=UPI0008DA2332|nr:class I SAM-dependent methyltransferase [Alterileibacterium massiliense]
MGFFQNTAKPIGFGGKLMVKLMNIGHAKVAEWGFSHVNISSSATVLDIGCGGGANVASWVKRCPQGHITGLDYSPVSVDASQNYNQKAIAENRCQIVEGDVSCLTFAENTFDAVSAFETVYFWPELENCFQEVFRVLKNGGIFLIVNESDGTDPKQDKWINIIEGLKIYKESDLTERLQKVGFSNIRAFHTDKNWLAILCEKTL